MAIIIILGYSISSLPDELLLRIVSFLDVSDLLRAAQVNMRWHRCCSDPYDAPPTLDLLLLLVDVCVSAVILMEYPSFPLPCPGSGSHSGLSGSTTTPPDGV